jgi:hypothetical protein
MARIRTSKKAPPTPQLDPKLGQYSVVATPEARAFIEEDGSESLESLKHERVSTPREVILREAKIKGRSTVLVAFLNPHVKTAYIAFLDKKRLDGDEPTKEKALRSVSLGIGARPGLPPGDEYVKSVWRDLIESG